MVLKATDKSSNTKALGLPLDNELHFSCREELFQLSDQLYMKTGMSCLSLWTLIYSKPHILPVFI